jgi:hypothetical protein
MGREVAPTKDKRGLRVERRLDVGSAAAEEGKAKLETRKQKLEMGKREREGHLEMTREEGPVGPSKDLPQVCHFAPISHTRVCKTEQTAICGPSTILIECSESGSFCCK